MKTSLLFIAGFLALSTFSRAQITQTTEEAVQTESIFIEALRNKMIGRYDLAIGQYLEILKKQPDNHVVHYELAAAYLNTKKPNEALEAIKNAVKGAPDQIFYLQLQADVYHTLQDESAEASVYKKLQSLAPSKELYYDKWSSLLMNLGQDAEALRVLDLMEREKGINEIGSFRKTQILERQGKGKEAEAELVKLNEAFPKDLKYLHALAGFYKRTKRDSKALEIYKMILVLAPQDEAANLALASTYKTAGQDSKYLEAISGLMSNPSISIDAKVLEMIPYLQKAISQKDQALLEVLEKHAATLVASHPGEAKPFAFYADILLEKGRYRAAYEHYRSALALEDRVAPVWEQFLSLSARFDPPASHLEMCEKAFDLFPNHPGLAFQYAHAFYQNEQYPECLNLLNQAMLMAGEDKLLLEKIWCLKGVAELKSGRQNEAEASFASALQLNPSSLAAKQMQAYALASVPESLDKAQELIQQAIRQSPDQYELEYTQAYILVKQKKTADARKWFEASLNHGGSGHVVILEQYGDLLYQLKEFEQAVQTWQKALELSPDNIRLKKKIADRSAE
ncbi:MAG TPA: tetratricopeptide repeat protein [Saprospiraceae bacterium]|nr:tetratricopeptide repeat protein [Saprospiraceae bacterium]HNT21047.1 tetratricopeptide repeat protein [Saprospiraceae bacterium]